MDLDLNGKRALVLASSRGLGLGIAEALAAEGANVLLCGRSADKLAEVKNEVEKVGGTVFVHTADLSDLESCDELVEEVVAQHGGVDILVNNAGRSIRRSVQLTYQRFHDFERTMQLNYFGAMKLIMGFLPAMQKQKGGHIVNISSMGVQTHPPRFGAYVASKAALDAFCRCAAPEFLDDNIAFTSTIATINAGIATSRNYKTAMSIWITKAIALAGNAIAANIMAANSIAKRRH